MFFQLQSGVTTILVLVLFVLTVGAFIDALTRRSEVFEAAGKLTKNGWMLILGLAAAAQLLLGFGLATFIGAIAMLVYFLDVRPAVAALTRRR
jgi:hypothetical protein